MQRRVHRSIAIAIIVAAFPACSQSPVRETKGSNLATAATSEGACRKFEFRDPDGHVVTEKELRLLSTTWQTDLELPPGWLAEEKKRYEKLEARAADENARQKLQEEFRMERESMPKFVALARCIKEHK